MSVRRAIVRGVALGGTVGVIQLIHLQSEIVSSRDRSRQAFLDTRILINPDLASQISLQQECAQNARRRRTAIAVKENAIGAALKHSLISSWNGMVLRSHASIMRAFGFELVESE